MLYTAYILKTQVIFYLNMPSNHWFIQWHPKCQAFLGAEAELCAGVNWLLFGDWCQFNFLIFKKTDKNIFLIIISFFSITYILKEFTNVSFATNLGSAMVQNKFPIVVSLFSPKSQRTPLTDLSAHGRGCKPWLYLC